MNAYWEKGPSGRKRSRKEKELEKGWRKKGGNKCSGKDNKEKGDRKGGDFQGSYR